MTQSLRLGPDLFLHLTDNLDIDLAHAGPGYWEHRDQPELASGRLMAVFSYDASWDYQERHPDGDELVLVLEGEVDFMLDTGDGERPVHVDHGAACVVPAGAWHRAVMHAPSTILFITPVPARTEHRTLTPAP